MKKHLLSELKGGWIVGDFEPSLIRSVEVEVAVKYYTAGQVEPRHHHKVAEEITVLAVGRARMCERTFEVGDIIHLEPNESTAFEALEDCVTVVIKRPSVPSDKYLDS